MTTTAANPTTRPALRTAWDIDSAHTDVGFLVRHMKIARVRGSFPVVAGRIEIDTDDITRSLVEVTIAAASVTTRNEQRDAHLRSEDFFHVDRFPELSFRSSGVEQPADGSLRVRGDLTIRGVTKQVVLEAELEDAGLDPEGQPRVAFSASTTIDRHDYGLTWNQALETGGVLVSREVVITVEGQAVRA